MRKHFHLSMLCVALLASLVALGCATQKPIVVSFPVGAEGGSASISSPSTPGAQTAQAPSQQPSATQSPPPPPPAPVAVPLTEFRTPDNTPEASPQPQTPQQVEQLVLQNNQLFEIRPEQDDYRGGDVEYNWVPNHIYELFVAPLELSTIVLEPGESVVNAPAAGDTANFMVATTYHIEKEQKIEEVLVKPIYAGKKTTLLINTDKRTYTFRVISYEALFMPLISFNYPLELAEKMKEDAASKENRILMFGRITDLDFAYQIIPHTIHKPAWCPDRVFTDGRKTYFSFPSASRASFAPVLFEVNSRNERVLLNYRVVGSYFIADHRIEHCELVLDVNEGNIIDIVHKED